MGIENAIPKINFPLILIKLGSLDHIIDLQKNGHLFCNSIHYFNGIEDGMLRGDPDEHVIKYRQIAPGTLMTLNPIEGTHKGKEIRIKLTKAVYKEHADNPLGNLFCMFAMRLSKQPLGHRFTIDPLCKGFGSHFFVILDTEKFFKRLDKAIAKQRLIHKRGFVEYTNMSKYNGERDLLQKDIKYSFQNEYRIIFRNDSFDPLHVYLGSLEDISKIYPASYIDHFTLMVNTPEAMKDINKSV